MKKYSPDACVVFSSAHSNAVVSVSFDKIDVYWHLGWLAFFLACGVAGLLLARMT